MLYTVGHSNYRIDSFLGIISEYRDDRTYVVDVRSVPFSSNAPQFNADSLKSALQAVGVHYVPMGKELHYVPMGKELGARRDELEAYNSDNQVDFTQTARLDLFQQGIQRIKKGLSLSCNIILMCSEKSPLECHRFALVARNLCKQGIQVNQQGIQVNHILGNHEVITQAQAEEVLIDKYQSQIDFLLSPSYSDRLDQAYSLLSRDIGYRKS